MNGFGRFEYWRELLLVILMLAVLVLDLTLTQSLWPYGEDGDGRTAAAKVAE